MSTSGAFRSGDGATDPNGMSVSSFAFRNDENFFLAGAKDREFALARYVNGELDSNFGNNGIALTRIGGELSDSHIRHIHIDSDGGLLASGWTKAYGEKLKIVQARYLESGVLDLRFGVDGILVLEAVNRSYGVTDFLLQSDGKMLVTGYISSKDSVKSNVFLARYNPDGSLDTSFGLNGIVDTPLNSGTSIALAIRLQDDDKILVVGQTQEKSWNGFYGGGQKQDIALLRYTTDGLLDETFGSSGQVISDIRNRDIAQDVIVLPDGKIVAVGASASPDLDLTLARYSTSGDLDSSFGIGGEVITRVGYSGESSGEVILVQSDGKIIVGGHLQPGSFGGRSEPKQYILARYDANGTLDNSFARNGVFVQNERFDGESRSGSVIGLYQDSNDYILVILSNGIVVRHNLDGSIDKRFDNFGEIYGAVNYEENFSQITLAPQATVFYPELAAADDYGGTSILLKRSGIANQYDTFHLRGDFSIGPQDDLIFYKDGSLVGYIIQNTQGILEILISNGTSQKITNEILRSINYQFLGSVSPESILLEWTFSDGNSGTQGSVGSISQSSTTLVHFQIPDVNNIATGSVSISGTAQQGQVLTASNTLADIDGLGEITYQWRSNGNNINGSTGSSFTLTQAEVGKAISVVASYTDQFGAAESVASLATKLIANANDAPAGSDPVSDTPSQGEDPTASDTQEDLDDEGTIDRNPSSSSPTVQPEIETVAITVPIDRIESIGFTPDGKFLVIKTNGVSKTVGIDDMLTFSDTSSTAQALSQSMTATPVFSSVVNGQTQYVLPDAFTGPESLNLKFQLIDDTPNAVVVGSSDNDFIKLSDANSAGKAVDGGGGSDVIDGGVGSTFISGGGGSNTFFLDGRASGVSWSTITDFVIGVDKATIWGWKPGTSRVALLEEFGGADGYKGLTLHFENLLPSDASITDRNSNLNSITFSDKSLSDFGVSSVDALNAQISAGDNPFFMVDQTVDEFGTHGYLYIA